MSSIAMRSAALAACFAALGLAAGAAHAVPLGVGNHSFETDPNDNFEFYFGNPTGWSLIDNGNIVDGAGDVQGTLTVTGSSYFGGSAPDGDNVAILFIGSDVGTSEIGLGQVLGDVLTANTTYTLTVAVGNINSGPTQQFGNFDLSGFPGYRIELLAGGTVLASDSEGIASPISEGVFADRTVSYTASAADALLGQSLEIRLYNTNLTDPAFPGVDLEVDFDNVRLDAEPVTVTAPAALGLFGLGIAGLGLLVRRR